MGVTSSGLDLEVPILNNQNTDIGGATSKIKNEDIPFGSSLETHKFLLNIDPFSLESNTTCGSRLARCHSHGLSPFSSPTSGCRKFKEYAIIQATPMKRDSGLLCDTAAQKIHRNEALQHHSGTAERSSTLQEYLASISILTGNSRRYDDMSWSFYNMKRNS